MQRADTNDTNQIHSTPPRRVERLAPRRGQRPAPRRAGFTLVEILVVVAIIAIIALVAGNQISATMKRARVSGSANDMKVLAQRAVTEMQARNQPTFLEVSSQASGFGFTYWRVTLYADSNGSGALEPAVDTVIGTVDTLGGARVSANAYSAISLSTLATNQIESANWSNNAADATTRVLECDVLGRAIDPATGLQISGIATLEITHNEMVPVATASLSPSLRYELRISPLWSTTLVRSRFDTATSSWKKL